MPHLGKTIFVNMVHLCWKLNTDLRGSLGWSSMTPLMLEVPCLLFRDDRGIKEKPFLKIPSPFTHLLEVLGILSLWQNMGKLAFPAIVRIASGSKPFWRLANTMSFCVHCAGGTCACLWGPGRLLVFPLSCCFTWRGAFKLYLLF